MYAIHYSDLHFSSQNLIVGSDYYYYFIFFRLIKRHKKDGFVLGEKIGFLVTIFMLKELGGGGGSK